MMYVGRETVMWIVLEFRTNKLDKWSILFHLVGMKCNPIHGILFGFDKCNKIVSFFVNRCGDDVKEFAQSFTFHEIVWRNTMEMVVFRSGLM